MHVSTMRTFSETAHALFSLEKGLITSSTAKPPSPDTAEVSIPCGACGTKVRRDIYTPYDVLMESYCPMV